MKLRDAYQQRQQEDRMRRRYNTKLTPSQEKGYMKWLGQESARQGRDLSLDEYTYDVRGYYKARGSRDERGHGPDTWKKPSHPTFSDESIYHRTGSSMARGKRKENIGGHWGPGSFTPSRRMLQSTHSMGQLREHFRRHEPGVKVKEP